MTLAELDTALKNRFPVIHEYNNTASPGQYFYSYVSAIIHRFSEKSKTVVIQAEVKNVACNSVAIVNPDELRHATPEEFTNYYKGLEKRQGDKIKDDSLLLLET